jgi:hypothetical protein
MPNFEQEIPPRVVRRLRRPDEMFARYAAEHLPGQELEPGPLLLLDSTQPTIALVEEVGEVDVHAAEDLGDGRIEVRCRVAMCVELDLNDDEFESETTEAKFRLFRTVGTAKGEVTEHHVYEAYHPDC